MIDLDDVLAHAHDNCVACEGTGVVRCWSPGGPCPDGQTVCESCGPCQQSDVPALVAALRKAWAERDDMKARNAILRQRPDLDVTRIPAYLAVVRERDEARAALARVTTLIALAERPGLIAGYPTVTTPALRAAITGPTPTEGDAA